MDTTPTSSLDGEHGFRDGYVYERPTPSPRLGSDREVGLSAPLAPVAF